MKHYFEDTGDVLSFVASDTQGLSPGEAAERLLKYGKNKLAEGKKKSILRRFIEQMSDPMIIVLLAAAIVSGMFSEIADMIIIIVVVILNGILGVYQEGKAEEAIEALSKLSSPFSKVRRGGNILQIKSEDIVPGDIVLMEAGDAVPADMRIIMSASLKIEEAPLTGESVPSDKDARTLSMSENGDDIPLGDRTNMAYTGSSVVYGRGEGVVIGTAMNTEMGKIAGIISDTREEKTPLQKKLASLSKFLSMAVLGICVFIFAFGLYKNGGLSGGHILETFMIAVSLAVAAIPEGMVAVVTIVLSLGVTRMSKRNAIIRRLTAVETLGCTQVICSDKTGTLTQNKMTVVEHSGEKEKLMLSMALCSDAQISKDDGTVVGEPTECALVAFALSGGLNKNELSEQYPRAGEAPFDSERKMMSTIHRDPEGFIQYTKGAPDEVLARCAYIEQDGKISPVTEELKNSVTAENKRMADKALRVLGAAYRRYDSMPQDISPDALERELVFIGLAGMIDPVRPEVKAAIEECRDAGIRPVMITGDHRDTAVAIAMELGIITDPSQAVTGAELEKISDADFERDVVNYSVYARVQPSHKVRIVNAWRKLGKITAMTGDGVNDAPSIKSADIGVGMGITGTDVTKNVADMVLADDNFATIVYAVEEGRRVYENIRKAIQFLLGSNLSEVLSLFVATLLGFRLFMPIHLLWINLVTDSLPAIALGMEEAERDSMKKPPRDAKDGVFSDGLGIGILYQGAIISALTLFSFFIGNPNSNEIGMTMAFLTLSMCEIFHSLNMRSRHKSIFKMNKQNKFLWGAMVLAFVLTAATIYIPGINGLFELEPLSAARFLEALGIAFLIIPIVEVVKLISNTAARKQ